jgi:hypothetical protein
MAAVERPCEVCNRTDREESTLLCDDCDACYHMQCLRPPLKAIPETDWYCPPCSARRVVLGTVVTVSALSKDVTQVDLASGRKGKSRTDAGTVPLSVALDLMPFPAALAVSDDSEGSSDSGSARSERSKLDASDGSSSDGGSSDSGAAEGGAARIGRRKKAGSRKRGASAAGTSSAQTAFHKAVKALGTQHGRRRREGGRAGVATNEDDEEQRVDMVVSFLTPFTWGQGPCWCWSAMLPRMCLLVDFPQELTEAVAAAAPGSAPQSHVQEIAKLCEAHTLQ